MTALVNLFYLYDPWFFHFLRMSFVMGIGACIWLAYKLYSKQFKAGINLPVESLAWLVALITLSFIPLWFNGTKDYSVVLMYSKSLILFLFGIAIYQLCYAKPQGQQIFVQDLRKGILIQAICGFIALCGVDWMIQFLLSSNVLLPRFYGSEQEYRLYNITSAAFFQLSIFYLLLLHFLLAYNHKHNDMPSYYVFLLLFIGVISGRSFFMLSAVSILLYFKPRYLPSLLLFAVIVLFLAKFYPENPYIAHALEPVINLLNGGKSISSSTDTLVQKHLFIPTIDQFIHGDGRYFTPDKRYYGGTDSGFLRQILYGGVAYGLLCFAFTAYFVRKVALHWFEGSWKFTLSTLGIFAVLNVKADTFAFPGIMLILLMFLSLFGHTGKQLTLFKSEK